MRCNARVAYQRADVGAMEILAQSCRAGFPPEIPQTLINLVSLHMNDMGVCAFVTKRNTTENAFAATAPALDEALMVA
jgi:hypothetical protein